MPPLLADVLAEQFAESPYKGDNDCVFAHPERGTRLETTRWYPEQFRAALAAAGITDYVRLHHDARHTALTNLAAAGVSGPTIMAIAGHRSYSTTQRYIDLAGIVFPDEMAALERRLLGGVSTEPSTRLAAPQPTSAEATAP